MRLAGIDEAGRGCVLGPLVLVGVLVEDAALDFLVKLGVRDSKRLSPRRRELLFPQITAGILRYEVYQITPKQIDAENLNRLESRGITELIRALAPQRAIFDAPTHPRGVDGFTREIASSVGSAVEVVGENHADQNYPVVSAASILAKVLRDRLVGELRENYGDFGSGYLADPKTQQFLRVWFEKYGDFPPMVRRKWRPVQRFLVPQSDLP